MKKACSIWLIFALVFSLSACQLYGDEGKNREKYEEALTLIEKGKEVEAYRLLYQAKEYPPAQEKIDEMLINDYMLQYRAAEVGHTVRFGRFEQDNDLGNGKEDIEWTVISMQDGKLMLLADYVLDCRQYYTANPEKYYTWADSDICDWLNNDFLREAFLEGERDIIVRVPVVTYEEGPQANQTAYLKVFLLSHEEYYGFDTSIKREYIDQIRLSAYTEARYKEGFHKTGTALVRNHFIFRDANKDGLYYLTGNSKAAYLNCSTSRMHGYYNIRPVIWLEYER